MNRKNYGLMLLCLLCALFIYFFAGYYGNDDAGASGLQAVDGGQPDVMDGSLNSVAVATGDDEGDGALRVLSEFEIEACNAADMAGTCDTKLKDLGIVSKAECCKHLSKCCQ